MALLFVGSQTPGLGKVYFDCQRKVMNYIFKNFIN